MNSLLERLVTRLLARWLDRRLARRRRRREAPPPATSRIVPAAPPEPGAELWVVALLLLAAAGAGGFIAVMADGSIPNATQYLGLSLGISFAALAAALVVVARRLVVTEELEHDYPPARHEPEERRLEQLLAEGGERFSRRRLLLGGGALGGGAIGLALVSPLVSFGPVFDLADLVATPWFRGRRLVGEDGAPLRAVEVEQADFYSAYPEGADREQLGAPLIVVRLPTRALHLPAGRAGWAPHGILAYSKICTHAGCAISLYRTPTFPALEPGPALVCPCHYSTFDPATGGTVLFGPAGRPLPQLPLEIGRDGVLRAAGTFSGPVGPSWWGVRSRRPT